MRLAEKVEPKGLPSDVNTMSTAELIPNERYSFTSVAFLSNENPTGYILDKCSHLQADSVLVTLSGPYSNSYFTVQFGI